MSEEVVKEYEYDPFHPQPEDYFSEYNQANNKPFDGRYLEFQELTWKVFAEGNGRKWLDQVKIDAFNQFADNTHVNLALHLACLEGVRKHLYNIEQIIITHKNHLSGKG